MHLGKPGPDRDLPVFTNLATEPEDVGKAAAMYAVADSNGTAGVIIFTDPSYAIANVKTNAAIAALRKCVGCSLLLVDTTSLKILRQPCRNAQHGCCSAMAKMDLFNCRQ